MKRTLSVIILCLSALSIFAQPQRSGFRQLLSYGGTPINVNTIIPMLTMNPVNGFTQEEAQRYGHEQLLDDMRAAFIPYYRPTLSFEDINFILAIYHSPEIRQAMLHLEVFSQVTREEQAKYISPAFTAIMNGNTPEPVKLKEGVSKEYLDAVTAYYLATGQGEQMAQLKNRMASTIDPNNEGAKNMGKIIDYLVAYNPTILANIAFGKVSTTELKLVTALYDTKPFQHFKAGNVALSAKSDIVVPQIMEKARQWKEKNKQPAED